LLVVSCGTEYILIDDGINLLVSYFIIEPVAKII